MFRNFQIWDLWYIWQYNFNIVLFEASYIGMPWCAYDTSITHFLFTLSWQYRVLTTWIGQTKKKKKNPFFTSWTFGSFMGLSHLTQLKYLYFNSLKIGVVQTTTNYLMGLIAHLDTWVIYPNDLNAHGKSWSPI